MIYAIFERFTEMSTNRTAQIGAILLLLVGLVGSPAVMATTVSIQPPSSTYSVGDSFSLSINISDVTDLYAFQFDIGFSPSILAAMGISEGTFLSGGVRTTNYIPGTIDNITGTVTFTADTLQDMIPGVMGSGSLATIDFNALDMGTSVVSLSNVILLDSNGNYISASIENGNITVNPAVIPAPEPGVLWLILSAFPSLLYLSGKSRRH
jgi:hypothetical protein